MTWTSCFKEVCKKQTQPMHQITHWAVFISTGLVFMFQTVASAAAASSDLIVKNPEIASGSWLATFFM